jgi:hypothetical protein
VTARRQENRKSRGFVVLVLAASLGVVIALAGLAVDLGFLEYYKRRAQVAADVAAVGGAREMQANDSASAVVAARYDAALNAFSNGVNGVTVTVNLPPSSGAYLANSKYLEVIVARPVATFFMRILTLSSVSVSARAVGGLTASPYCIVALDPSVAGALTLQGSATVNMPGCGVMVDSNNSLALTIGNASCLTASAISVVGNYTSGGCIPSPQPNVSADFVYDLFATLAAPAVGACQYNNTKVNTDTVLSPGVYCGGIDIVSSGHTITLNPGTYILNGGGLRASGGNTLQGTGVTFYNTVTAGQSYSDVSIQGNSTLRLSAPTSGPMEGILFFQDRNIPTTSTAGDRLSGDSNSFMDGAIYVPSGKITYAGNSSLTGYTNIVAKTIEFSGSSTVRSDYSTLTNGAPFRAGALVE